MTYEAKRLEEVAVYTQYADWPCACPEDKLKIEDDLSRRRKLDMKDPDYAWPNLQMFESIFASLRLAYLEKLQVSA